MGTFSAGTFKVKKVTIPWFLFIKDFNILITSPTIPTTISDKKKIVYSEIPVPGKNYTQKIGIRGENRILSFTLPIINRLSPLGNSNILQAFELLRNSDSPSLASLVQGNTPQQFKSSPKVIYYWGTHSSPLEYFVNVCDFEHNSTLTNKMNRSQFTNVSFELELDESSALYKADRVSRVIQARAGIRDSTKRQSKGGRPY